LKLDKDIRLDLDNEELEWFLKNEYVCVDTETTGLDYKNDDLCIIQLYSEGISKLIRFDKKNSEYKNLRKLLESNEVLKIFHNAVFDVSFLMENLNMDRFGKIVCTKITSKLVNGLNHNNSLKPLLKEYLNVEISKDEQLSDWTRIMLSDEQIEYAINDARYLYDLWNRLHLQLVDLGMEELAETCFNFVSSYKKLTDKGINNIFSY